MDAHEIRFKLRSEVSISVLEEIWYNFSAPVMVKDFFGDLTFSISLTQNEAIDFTNMVDWAISEICDMDQEDGGSFI